MNIRQMIERVDEAFPNTVDMRTKIRWLSELDESIYEDIILTHCGKEAYMHREANGAYTHRPFPYTEDTQELIAPPQFSKMYEMYLCLEMDLRRGEWARYTNDLMLFNGFYESFAARYHQTHLPAHTAVIHTHTPRVSRQEETPCLHT